MPPSLDILIVGLNYAPEPVGIGPYTTGLAQWLAARGYRVRVVAGKPYYPQWQTYAGYAAMDRKARVESGVAVARVAHYVPANPSGARRIVHHLSFALSALPAAIAAVLRQRPLLVITVAPSLLSVPVAWLAARLGGAKLWLHVQDLEIDAALATGLIGGKRGGGGMLARLALSGEALILRLADRISTISPQMAARIVAKGVAPERVGQLRNWSDPAFGVAGDGGAAYRAKWGLEGRRVALYSGNISNKQGIEVLVEAARILASRTDFALVICGEGPNRARLAGLAAGLDNVQLHDLQPAAQMGELLAMADVHLLPQIAGAADLVLPSKLTNMLVSGRPVVATALPGSGLADEIKGCGIITPPADASALANAIGDLLDDQPRMEALGQAARRRAAERWAQDAILMRFEGEAAALVAAAPVTAHSA